MKETFASGRVWTLSFSSWEEWVYTLSLPPPDYQQANKCGYSLPLEAGGCSVAFSGRGCQWQRSHISQSTDSSSGIWQHLKNNIFLIASAELIVIS